MSDEPKAVFHYGLAPQTATKAKKAREIPPHYIEPWPRDRSVGKKLGMDRRDFEQAVALEVEKRMRNGGYVDRAAKSEHRRLRKKAVKAARVEFSDWQTIIDMEAPRNDLDVALDCMALLDTLEPRRRAVLVKHYLLGMTDAEIASLFGFSESRARQLRVDGLARLQKSSARPLRKTARSVP